MRVRVHDASVICCIDESDPRCLGSDCSLLLANFLSFSCNDAGKRNMKRELEALGGLYSQVPTSSSGDVLLRHRDALAAFPLLQQEQGLWDGFLEVLQSETGLVCVASCCELLVKYWDHLNGQVHHLQSLSH